MTDPRTALEDAYQAIYGVPGLAWFNGEHGARFRRFLDAEAWTDAAMMLVPDGWSWATTSRNCACCRPDRVESVDWHYAETPALALTAACLKAKEVTDGR